MLQEQVAPAVVPPHVPRERVVDWDLYDPPGAEEDFHRSWIRLQNESRHAVVWTTRNGGHWIPLRGKDIFKILADYSHFPTKFVTLPETRGMEQKVLPTTLSPPIHGAYRALLNPGVSPKAIHGLEPSIRDMAVRCIESFRTRGHCDFISEYSVILPLSIFMKLVDLPVADIPRLKYLADQVTRPDGSITMTGIMDEFAAYLRPYLVARRETPGDDMLSYMANGKINGELIALDEAMDLCVQFLIAGMDTVASFLGFMMLFLAQSPGHRQQLLDDPNLIPAAVDEFLRRFGLVTLARSVARDYEIDGVVMKAGDNLAVPTMLHGLDEREFGNPFDVDFHREVGPHSTFGNGHHRCPGSFLARTEIRVTLEEWLKRIPHFTLDPGRPVRMAGGVVGSILSLPLCWDEASTRRIESGG